MGTTHPGLLPYEGTLPAIADDVFIAPGAVVIGDVHLGANSSVWFNSVVRGDVYHIRIGERVNIQDGTVIHVTTDTHATIIADDVTIGHRAVLHGCTLQSYCLIGMGAIVMDAAVIGERSLIGAGAVVTPGTVIPPRVLAMGAPAKVRRELTDDEIANLEHSPGHYARLASRYREA